MGRRGPNMWVGGLAGYVASRAMDASTTWFHGYQSDESLRVENDLAPGGALVQIGKQVGRGVRRELDDEQAGRVGLALHRSLGVGYGMAAAALVRRGVHPVVAGLAVGTAALIVVDEGTAISQFSAYPVESHLRGVVGHSTLGLVVGTLLLLMSGRRAAR